MKLKNKLLLATIISLGVYIFLVYVAIKIFLYPELLKSELNNIFEKERRSELLIKYQLDNLKYLTEIIGSNTSLDQEITNFKTLSDFIYIFNIKTKEEKLLLSDNLKSNKKFEQNNIKNFIESYVSKNILNQDASALTNEIGDIIDTKLGTVLLSLKKTNNNPENLIIVGQFLEDSIFNKLNFGKGWNIKILFDEKLIHNLINYKVNSEEKIKQKYHLQKFDEVTEVKEQRELLLDKSQLKSYYLIKVGSFARDILLEISIREGLIYHSNVILIFTFLATLLSGPLALLFLILIVRIIQAHEV